ncbi:MAG: translation elongation factor Ts, partial [Armatimonadota bacterium]|nr:translation elongation factor Ts [Armatimonadota bacterium]
MAVSLELVKELRARTGAGMMDCKGALEEAGGDLERAVELLRKRGLAQAAKRAGRAATQGLVDAYIHGGGSLGVLVEVNCETDFVARTEEFRQLVRDLALQIAARDPRYVRREDVPEAELEREREIARAQLAQQLQGKPPAA